ncbi:MAG: hypothetical protein WBD78_11170 [Methylocella sp.]
MSSQEKPRRAGGATGALDSSLLTRIDGRGSSPPRQNLQPQNRLRRQRLVEKLHGLGPSPLFHFLDEIENGAGIDERLERYAQLPAGFIEALGGRDFPPGLGTIAGDAP